MKKKFDYGEKRTPKSKLADSFAQMYSNMSATFSFPNPTPTPPNISDNIQDSVSWLKKQPEYKELEKQLAESEAERMQLAVLWGKEREENVRLKKLRDGEGE